jgi:putative ABC transport system substrate-binding protein
VIKDTKLHASVENLTVVGLNVDLIVAANGAAGLAAKSTTKKIPIVIATMEDPVKQGFAASFARPGGNITGLSLQTPDMEGKRLELFKEALPNLVRVAVLVDASGRPQAREIEMKFAETTAHALNVGLGPIVEVRRPEEIAGASPRPPKKQTVCSLSEARWSSPTELS